MKELLKKIYKKIIFRGIMNFDQEEPDVREWKEYLEGLPNPKDDIDISWCKFLCRKYFLSKGQFFLFQLGAAGAFVTALPVLFRKGKEASFIKKDTGIVLTHPDVGYEDVFPMELKKRYKKLYYIERPIDKPNKKRWYLRKECKDILMKCFKRHPFQLYWLYFCYRELCMYSYLVDTYQPEAIIEYINERNCVGPILTGLCEKRGMEYISFMHGEYLLQLIQGYMRFSRHYIWDREYRLMFQKDLKCRTKKYIVYQPKKYIPKDVIRKSTEEYPYFATYYLEGDSLQRLEKIGTVFRKFENQGYRCRVRPHPRRSDLNAIRQYFTSEQIENLNHISLEESLRDTRYVVGLKSTVLSEGWHSGKEIVVDDYSEPARYQNLKKRGCVLLKKKHLLLSQLIEVGATDERKYHSK